MITVHIGVGILILTGLVSSLGKFNFDFIGWQIAFMGYLLFEGGYWLAHC